MSGEVFHARVRPDGSVRIVYPHRLTDLYAELNERFWSGQLPPILRSPTIFASPPRYVMLRRVSCGVVSYRSPWLPVRKGLRGCGGSYARGTFRPPGQHWPAQIRIVSPLPADEERAVLLHEMIHCGLWFAGFTSEQHGPRFVAELERLATMGEAWTTDEGTYYREHPE